MDTDLEKVFSRSFTFSRDHSWILPSLDDAQTDTSWNDNTLISFKSDLNDVKSLLNCMEPTEWRHHTTKTSIAGRVIPHLQNVIQPALLTQAWCKFWEIINKFRIISDLKEDSVYSSLHLCEAPGAFVTALNHYMKLNHPSISWNWIANTLNPYFEGNSTAQAILDDRFIFHTLDHWHFGENNTGDILDPNLTKYLEKVTKNFEINLITADGSIDCQDVPDEQESTVARLFLAETYSALSILTPNGCFVIKLFTFFECETISLLYTLTCVFKEVHVFKPATSKSGNSEVYVVCIGYKGRRYSQSIISSIEAKLRSKEAFILKREFIPESFLEQVRWCSESLKNSQIETIKLNIRLFDEMTREDEKDIKVMRNLCAEQFILQYNLRPIGDEMEIVRGMPKEGLTMMFKYSQKSGSRSYSDRKLMKNSWQRKLGAIKALVRDVFKNRDVCVEFWDTASIAEFISKLMPGQVLTGNRVDRIWSSLFCPVVLLKAWNDLEDRRDAVGLKFHEQEDTFATWQDKIVTLQELKLNDELMKVDLSHHMVIVTSKRNSKLAAEKTSLKNLPCELKETGWDVGEPKRLLETDIEFQKLLVQSCLKLLYVARTGDTVLLRLNTVHTRFTAGVLFLLCSLFERVKVVIPDEATPMEPQIWCFCSFKPHGEMKMMFDHLSRILCYLSDAEEGLVVLETVPIKVLCVHQFYRFLIGINNIVILRRIWHLAKKL